MGILSRLFGTDEAKVEVAWLSGRATIVALSEGGPYVKKRERRVFRTRANR